MPSPFPGMNPFLESPNQWEDFHNAFVSRLRDSLVPQLGTHYRAKLNELLFVHTEEEYQPLKPDASVLIEGGASGRGGGGAAVAEAVAVLDPPVRMKLEQPDVAERHWYVEIQDRLLREARITARGLA